MTLAKRDNMNKRTPKIILGAIIAVVLIGVSAKPLLIKYHLYKYNRASAVSQLFDQSKSFVPTKFKTDLNKQFDSLIALNTLGYLHSFSIPVQSPRTDAEDTIELLSAFCTSHNIPALAVIENEPSGVVLNIVDKPETRPYWDMFVRYHLEQKE